MSLRFDTVQFPGMSAAWSPATKSCMGPSVVPGGGRRGPNLNSQTITAIIIVSVSHVSLILADHLALLTAIKRPPPGQGVKVAE
jgi:hypothetical protein